MTMPKRNHKDRGAVCNALDREIGIRIRTLRLARKFSQTKLGHMLGVTFQQIQKYENGSNSVAACRLPALCNALQCSPNDLLRWNVTDELPAVPELSSLGVTMALAIDRLPVGPRSAVRGLIDAMVDGDSTQ